MFTQSLCWWLQHNQVLVLKLSLSLHGIVLGSHPGFTPGPIPVGQASFQDSALTLRQLEAMCWKFKFTCRHPCMNTEAFSQSCTFEMATSSQWFEKNPNRSHQTSSPSQNHSPPTFFPSSLPLFSSPSSKCSATEMESKPHFSANTPLFCSYIFWFYAS